MDFSLYANPEKFVEIGCTPVNYYKVSNDSSTSLKEEWVMDKLFTSPFGNLVFKRTFTREGQGYEILTRIYNRFTEQDQYPV